MILSQNDLKKFMNQFYFERRIMNKYRICKDCGAIVEPFAAKNKGEKHNKFSLRFICSTKGCKNKGENKNLMENTREVKILDREKYEEEIENLHKLIAFDRGSFTQITRRSTALTPIRCAMCDKITKYKEKVFKNDDRRTYLCDECAHSWADMKDEGSFLPYIKEEILEN